MDQTQTYTQSYRKGKRTSRCTDDMTGSRTISEVLYSHFMTQPDREALVFAHTDGTREAVTYRELWENVNILAKSFISLGVRKSEFVAISMRTCPEWLYATFGALLAGARPITLSLTYTDGSDIVAMMQKLQTCSAFVLDPGVKDENWKIICKLVSNYDKSGTVKSESMPYLRYLICHDCSEINYNALSLKEMMKWKNCHCVLPSLSPDGIAVLLQTSGSTGVPKVVAHTHKSLIAGSEYFNGEMSQPDAILYNDRPFTWIGGFPVSILSGETRVTWSGFCKQPDDEVGFLIDVVKRENCDFMVILPPRLNSLMERKEEVGSDWPIQQLGTGGQPITKKFSDCLGKLCKRFVSAYGSTEGIFCSALAVENSKDFMEYSIGYPCTDNEMKIIDASGSIVPPNQRGEMCIRSNGLFKEYYNDPEKTRVSLKDDGWFHTDDVGFMSQNGMFFCEGRQSDEIITGAVNVEPAILEAVLGSFGGVSRVACVPVPHEVMFQVICACVIVKEGSDVTEADLRSFCEEVHNDKPRLFTALPTYYMFMKEFPETYSGKISRRDLAELAKKRFLS